MIAKIFNSFNHGGSSYSLPAHGRVGARARNLAAHFASQNTNPVGAKSESAAEGGVGRPEAEQARYGVKIPPRPSEYRKRPAPPPCSFRAEQHKKVTTGARGGSRTLNPLRATDLKSVVYSSSTTRAYLEY